MLYCCALRGLYYRKISLCLPVRLSHFKGKMAKRIIEILSPPDTSISLRRVHEKNYNTVYVAITLANNVAF